jgi:hemoglobin
MKGLAAGLDPRLTADRDWSRAPDARTETGESGMSETTEPIRRSVYEAAGGEEAFTRLVHRFYEEVAKDPLLRPVYPAKDLGPAEENMRLFLIQYWGGPATYSERRGHPRLHKRHVRFRIGETERDLWLRHMRTALDDLRLDEALDRQIWNYLVMGAHSLVNDLSEGAPDAGWRGDLGITPA